MQTYSLESCGSDKRVRVEKLSLFTKLQRVKKKTYMKKQVWVTPGANVYSAIERSCKIRR